MFTWVRPSRRDAVAFLDPSSEKLAPLVEAAADAGAEVYSRVNAGRRRQAADDIAGLITPDLHAAAGVLNVA